ELVRHWPAAEDGSYGRRIDAGEGDGFSSSGCTGGGGRTGPPRRLTCELRPDNIEHRLQAILEPCLLDSQPVALGGEYAKLRHPLRHVQVLHEQPRCDELADLSRVLGVVHPGAVVLHLLELLRHRGEHGDRGVAALAKVLGEGGTVVAAELEPHEHARALDAGEGGLDVLVSGIEAHAAYVHPDRGSPPSIGPSGDELVEPLAGVDSY